jgi:hypothetical protein
MADTVQFYMEEMIPEMRDLEQKKIFSKVGEGLCLLL